MANPLYLLGVWGALFLSVEAWLAAVEQPSSRRRRAPTIFRRRSAVPSPRSRLSAAPAAAENATAAVAAPSPWLSREGVAGIAAAGDGDDGGAAAAPSSLSSDRDLCFGGVGRLYNNAAAESAAASGRGKGQEAEPSSSSPSLSPAAVLDRLQRATAVVVGVGGVGSWAAEALGRSGVGNLVLVDLDDVCRSNVNRQVHALRSTVGRMKVDVLRERLADISPSCNVTCVRDFVTPDNVHEILDAVQGAAGPGSDGRRRSPPATAPVVVLDAMDGSADKAGLAAACARRRVPLVVCGGAAGRTDPTSVVSCDLTRARDDRLLVAVRRALRKRHGFPEGAAFGKKQPRPWRITAVYSTQKELVSRRRSSPDPPPPSSSLRRCDGDLGTACFVTGTFGFVAAGCVVDMIANDRYKIPSVRS